MATPRPRLPLTVRTINPADAALLADLEAAAHLQRTTSRQLVADIVARALGPKFAKHIAA